MSSAMGQSITDAQWNLERSLMDEGKRERFTEAKRQRNEKRVSDEMARLKAQELGRVRAESERVKKMSQAAWLETVAPKQQRRKGKV